MNDKKNEEKPCWRTIKIIMTVNAPWASPWYSEQILSTKTVGTPRSAHPATSGRRSDRPPRIRSPQPRLACFTPCYLFNYGKSQLRTNHSERKTLGIPKQKKNTGHIYLYICIAMYVRTQAQKRSTSLRESNLPVAPKNERAAVT